MDWSGDFSLHTKKGVGLVLLALVMTIAGWSRAESLVIKRVGARDVGQARRKGKPQFQVQAGFGGLPFFVARIFTRCMLLGLFMVAFMVFIIVMTRHSRENLGGIDLIREGLSSLKNDFYIWSVLLIQLVPTVAHIRFLRTLPLSTLVLATTLVLVPTTAIVLLGGLIAVLAGTGSATDSIMSTYLIAASVGAVSVAVLVWRSADRDSMALFLFVMFFGFVVPMWFQADRTPLWVMISVVVSAVCLAIAITRRALMRSCHTYRVPPVNAWGMMMGWRS
ncbi:MAG: hypothetical protein O2960_04585 [Verrucomicrobia bacterium]|nr:hypothetical protein [Verrucomicrobiota bacterium]